MRCCPVVAVVMSHQQISMCCCPVPPIYPIKNKFLFVMLSGGGPGDVIPPNFNVLLSGDAGGDVTPPNFNVMLSG